MILKANVSASRLRLEERDSLGLLACPSGRDDLSVESERVPTLDGDPVPGGKLGRGLEPEELLEVGRHERERRLGGERGRGEQRPADVEPGVARGPLLVDAETDQLEERERRTNKVRVSGSIQGRSKEGNHGRTTPAETRASTGVWAVRGGPARMRFRSQSVGNERDGVRTTPTSAAASSSAS